MAHTAEHRRLDEFKLGTAPWKKWGPYLSERQWGTVREDYSDDGNAWDYFSHDQSRSRTYRWGEDGLAGISDDHQVLCFALALVNPDRLRRILTIMLDENEFLGPYGLRSISKYHDRHPYIFHVNGTEYRVAYLPAESDTGMFGGNSNWRGPVWVPVNVLIIRALIQFYLYYGDNFKIECPTGSGRLMNLFDVAKDISERLIKIFLRDSRSRRPVFGGADTFQTDPHWRDNLLFYEYFHGDNGAGLGASHQTGWTGCVAKLIEIFGLIDAKMLLEGGKKAAFLKDGEKR
jgi:hypothetical protein